MPEEEERDHIRQTIDTIRDICGVQPLGWYTGRYSENTRRLVMEETDTLYDFDAYNDDLPYWVQVAGQFAADHSLCARHQRLQVRDQPRMDVRGGLLHLP